MKFRKIIVGGVKDLPNGPIRKNQNHYFQNIINQGNLIKIIIIMIKQIKMQENGKQKLLKSTVFMDFVIIIIGLKEKGCSKNLLMKFFKRVNPIFLSVFLGQMNHGQEDGTAGFMMF
jgi:hypothetical protein